MIFYFTATGNCLYAARELAAEGEAVRSIPQELRRAGVAARDAAAGDGCNACLACIHACPARAIELPMGEKNPEARFRNEHVSLADLVAANG
ncbi:MAG TPA: hypothetical protein IAA19_02200 [Candidatus Olsenella pullistercoris]|uniref:4Fe-4S ferredoxin-type domain-containing protein n=1 Tax=Candidatus Olsenella pullistercoris TaxID=2838712 RepID=A0A9D2JDP6_9ACTN|nr:hypothetical protein [Candidatus Olsenella pullistercoris]